MPSPRTFILHTPLPDSTEARFVKLTGHEALSTLSAFDLEFWSGDANIKATDLLGKNLTVEVINQEGNSRYINALVTEFLFEGPTGSAGRYYAYHVKLSSWLWLAGKTADSKIFQNKSVPTILSEVLQGFGLPFQMDVTGNYPVQEYRVQYQETKLTFVQRLAEEAGIFFYTKHAADSHTLYFTDGKHDTLPDYATIPFLTPSEKTLEAEEYVAEWTVQNQVPSGSFATRSYDFTAPGSTLDESQTVKKGHTNDALEMYEWTGTYTSPDVGGTLSTTRREQQQLDFEVLTGTANVRGIMPGFFFTLKSHPRSEANTKYLIVGAQYDFQESPDTTSDNSTATVTSWRVQFTARNATNRYWPPRVTPKPHVPGVQTAVVSGPAGKTTWTNEYGQIKLTFFWDRYAKHDETDTKWVRVAASWAGAKWGESMVPRIGQEVAVLFEDGDPDRPLIVGRVNNANQMPNSFSNTGNLPGNVALSGLKSQELEGSGYNQLLMDDTKGEIRVQLASDHAKTQLNLGYLVQPRNVSATARGEGFELRSDAKGVVRAAQGLLITTEGRLNGREHITDMPETLARLDQGEGLHNTLSSAAQQAKAHETGDQDAVVTALKSQQTDIKGQGGSGGTGGTGAPEFEKPHLTLASPAGVQTSTQGSTHVVSNEHNALTSGGHTSISAGKSLLVSVQNAVRLFAYKAGMKLVSATAGIEINALKDSISILAKLNITHTANRITITAKEEVQITGGNSFTRWNGSGIEHGTSGTWHQQAGKHSVSGPASAGAPALPPPMNLDPGKLDLYHQYICQAGQKVESVKQGDYKVTDAEGGTHQGKLDANGFASVPGVAVGEAKVKYGEDPRDPWEQGSYFGKGDAWPANPIGAPDKAATPSPLAAAPSAAGLGSAAGSLGKMASGGAGGLSSLTGAMNAIPGAKNALGGLSPMLNGATQAMGMVSAVEKGGAQGLAGPAMQMASSNVPGGALLGTATKAMSGANPSALASSAPSGFSSAMPSMSGVPSIPKMSALPSTPSVPSMPAFSSSAPSMDASSFLS